MQILIKRQLISDKNFERRQLCNNIKSLVYENNITVLNLYALKNIVLKFIKKEYINLQRELDHNLHEKF